MPPRPTTSTVISETWRISQRPLQFLIRCWASSRPRSFAPAKRPKTANSASGSAVHPRRGGEEDPAQLVRAQSGGLHLTAAAGRHGLDPAELGIRVRRPLQGRRVDIGNAVEDVGRVDHVRRRPAAGSAYAGTTDPRRSPRHGASADRGTGRGSGRSEARAARSTRSAPRPAEWPRLRVDASIGQSLTCLSSSPRRRPSSLRSVPQCRGDSQGCDLFTPLIFARVQLCRRCQPATAPG